MVRRKEEVFKVSSNSEDARHSSQSRSIEVNIWFIYLIIIFKKILK